MMETKTETRDPSPSRGNQSIHDQNNCKPRNLQADSDYGIMVSCSLLLNFWFYGFTLMVEPIKQTYCEGLTIYIVLLAIQRDISTPSLARS